MPCLIHSAPDANRKCFCGCVRRPGLQLSIIELNLLAAILRRRSPVHCD